MLCVVHGIEEGYQQIFLFRLHFLQFLHFLLEKAEGVVDTAVLEVSLGHGGHVASVRGLFVVKYGLFNKLVVVGVRGNLKESVAQVVTLDLCRV